jgi:hypothetical protein
MRSLARSPRAAQVNRSRLYKASSQAAAKHDLKLAKMLEHTWSQYLQGSVGGQPLLLVGLASPGLFITVRILRQDKAIGNGFRLNGRKNDVPRVRDNNGTSAAAVGSINELAAIAGVRNNSFDGGRFWTHNRNHAVSRYDVAKAYVN